MCTSCSGGSPLPPDPTSFLVTFPNGKVRTVSGPTEADAARMAQSLLNFAGGGSMEKIVPAPE